MNNIMLSKLKDMRDLYLKDRTGTPQNRISKWQSWEGVQNIDPILDLTSKRIWFISDTHFGHKNIIKFSSRPFGDTEHMREQLILNFNNLVQPDDISIWVGDVSFLSDNLTNQILYRLNGQRILIIGNHDFEHGKVKKLAFDEVHITYIFETENKYKFVFTHYPMSQVPYGYFNVHGHEHIAKTQTNKATHINVCCEFHDYKPISLAQLEFIALQRNINQLEKEWGPLIPSEEVN